MENLTLKELCDTLNVTRRAVQGYEKAGLVRATAKNNMGHLLYDKKSQEKVGRIRLYQQIGFTIKEIQWLFIAPNEEVKKALEDRVEHLLEEKKQIDEVIKKAYELIGEL